VQAKLRLKQVDPVDLEVPHRQRLSRKLVEMARSTYAADGNATYSVVLHGPPGSSKTTAAQALSLEIWKGAKRWEQGERRLIRITPADFTRLGEDRVDSEAQYIFNLISRIRGVTILFDEIDDLLRRRDRKPGASPNFLDLVIPAMLNRLQDLRDKCEEQELCFLFGTNYIDRIEPALLRKGRIDEKLPVAYPDFPSRAAIAQRHLKKTFPELYEGKGAPDQQLVRALAKAAAVKTAGWPWSGIDTVAARMAAAARETRTQLLAAQAKDQLVPALDTLLTPLLAEEHPHMELGATYAERLKGDSPELATEYLYYEIALCKAEGSAALSRHLAPRISTVKARARRERLRTAYIALPHTLAGLPPAPARNHQRKVRHDKTGGITRGTVPKP
jgi:SpoVK/Ycf46/Vps4 family AAA+-type ATPase